MAEAAITFAVEKLGDLVIQKAGFLLGVEDQVKWLKGELERMQSFLKDAAEKQANDERIRKWISDIREVAQDADDVIETFNLKVDTPRRSKGLQGMCACFPKHVYHLDRLGQEIESIKTRLERIDKSRERYGIQNLGEGMKFSSKKSEDVERRRRLSPWQIDKHLVGLKEDVELLIKKVVLADEKGLSVDSIVGMGGIGKSTLARTLYNHAAVAAGFDCRAWVCVSNEFNIMETIKVLVLQLLKPEEDKLKILEIMEKSPVPHLISMLHERLKGRRYFIVLDDVWREEAWKSLESAFPDEQDKASRLLLTSRSRDIPGDARYVHVMKTLDPEKSWQLFLKKAFHDDTKGKCPEDLEDIGREILRKCDGLPLAITVVGGLLVKERQSRSGWEKVLKRMSFHLGRGTSSSVSAILELSYHDLPPQLKSCFLCLGFFKEDATIRTHKLVRVWIAEGLVPQEGGGEETMEEIATSFLDELINRNMVQVEDISKDGRVKNCHIHDLLRELSITKAKEEISFEILREGNSQSSDKPRHRAIYCSTSKFTSRGNPNRRLRSVFFHGGCDDVVVTPSYWKSFDLLRVLDFEDYGLKNLPDTIGALIGLRYLGLRNNSIRKLPRSLGRLKNLEVLDIAENYGVRVPNVLWKMHSLCHLYIDVSRFNEALRIETLKNLQTLNYIPVDIWMAGHHPAQMTSLRKLGINMIDGLTDVSKLCTTLAMLENLVCLKLRGSFVASLPMDSLVFPHRLTQLKLQARLTGSPSACNFPPNLSCLTLALTCLTEDPMPVLEKLPKLLYLKLSYYAYRGEEMLISHDGFPKLEILRLHCLERLRNIQVNGKGAMPVLKQLQIDKCPALENLPEELSRRINQGLIYKG